MVNTSRIKVIEKKLRELPETLDNVIDRYQNVVGGNNIESGVIICYAVTNLAQFRIVKVYSNGSGLMTGVMYANYLSLTEQQATDVTPYIYGVTQNAVLAGGAVNVKIEGVTLVEIEPQADATEPRFIKCGTKLGVAEVTGKASSCRYSSTKHVCLEAIEEMYLEDEVVWARILGREEDTRHNLKITGIHGNSPTGPTAIIIQKGDLYDGQYGFDSVATKIGVTVIPYYIAAGEVIPTGYKFGADKKVNFRWQDKLSAFVIETVYRINVPVII